MLQKIVPVGGGNDNRKLDHQQLGVTRQVNCLAVVRMGICGPVGNKSGVVAQSAAEQPWPDATANTGSGFKASFPIENYRPAGSRRMRFRAARPCGRRGTLWGRVPSAAI
jgi:hypothetical protein